VYPKSFSEKELTREHVPLLFYSPQLLQPELVHHVCSQLDIMPSVATLLKAPYRNNAMGQSLFDSSVNYQQSAFVIDHEAGTIGMVNNEYYYVKNARTNKTDLVSITNNVPVPVNKTTDSIKNYLGILADAYYTTSKYLLFNNRKK